MVKIQENQSLASLGFMSAPLQEELLSVYFSVYFKFLIESAQFFIGLGVSFLIMSIFLSNEGF